MTAEVALLLNAQRMLVAAQTTLLDLAEQVGRGERQGRDGETAMAIGAISGRISDALDLLFDADGPAPRLADA
ncbi:hypothetical protein [Massilia sp. PWRC2]|uniref:hypothetical protein n=1 Tax=Massilia sp. PWRC2 TaxID=2804626 RepID=UPI003CEBDCCB